jgi:hypothetical protein
MAMACWLCSSSECTMCCTWLLTCWVCAPTSSIKNLMVSTWLRRWASLWSLASWKNSASPDTKGTRPRLLSVLSSAMSLTGLGGKLTAPVRLAQVKKPIALRHMASSSKPWRKPSMNVATTGTAVYQALTDEAGSPPSDQLSVQNRPNSVNMDRYCGSASELNSRMPTRPDMSKGKAEAIAHAPVVLPSHQ